MDCTVVIPTRNRRHALPRTLSTIRAEPDPPPVIVVDNASGDEVRGAACCIGVTSGC